MRSTFADKSYRKSSFSEHKLGNMVINLDLEIGNYILIREVYRSRHESKCHESSDPAMVRKLVTILGSYLLGAPCLPAVTTSDG